MLILSRKQDQNVSFPDLGITVKILGVRGSTVRVGFDAPVEFKIVRGELPEAIPHDSKEHQIVQVPPELRHKLRNQLNSLSIATHLYKEQVAAGFHKEAEKVFKRQVELLESILEQNQISSEDAKYLEKKPNSILLVEDQDNEREMLAGLLEMHGYQVATSKDGADAIEHLENNPLPSIILFDMRMPRCDGPTAIRHIRKNEAYNQVKIFAISGTTPEDCFAQSENEGVNAWFMKPLNPGKLIDAMAVSCRT
ncbi:response regulator [Gimesia aquarii]|uniref:CAI-1 autoinducer sensor kinase/phosphatase CqsS n=1 Tax=Gimesia aquarii TaxID=2527964 RepID=A0A517X1X2_9PLAN|nr:response regulator [Gimesia aquarii]QDU11500.1 CAI-1 autoinducer sensor kinase/phosphatase CqsS [Gimesia aquarii]